MTTTEWMSEKEVADYLGVSPRTIRKWRKADDPIPHTRAGPRLVRYHKEEVDEWMKSGREETT